MEELAMQKTTHCAHVCINNQQTYKYIGKSKCYL